MRLAEDAHIHIGYGKIILQCVTTCGRISEPNAVAFTIYNYSCERSELYVRVGWRISLVYIYIYIYLYPWVDHLVPRGPRVTRNAQTSDGRFRFNGQCNRLENGYFSSKPWLEIGSSYEAADLPTYL